MEIQDIFKTYFLDFSKNYLISYEHYKVVNALIACHSEALGSHVDICDTCGHQAISYNSCRNRHCPKCNTATTAIWLDKQQQALLPIQYFHVVFTVPDTLNDLFLHNHELCYNLLFKAVSETLLELSKDPKHLGADIGFTSILHTWGQNLSFHPHLHCIVTGGGLSNLNNKFVPSKKKFLIRVEVLSEVFRGKFLYYLKKLYKTSPSDFYFPSEVLDLDSYFYKMINALYKVNLVVYAKPTFKHASAVLKYLGRYTHRVAISNSRIISMDNGLISFTYQDRRDNNKTKIMTLTAHEFIRRFLLHVLPRGFVKIRHYGILCNRYRKDKVALIRKLIGISSIFEKLLQPTNDTYKPICPVCKHGHLVFSHKLNHVRLVS